jgi:hypothetical protein
MISGIKKKYFEDFNIDLEKARKRALVSSENGTITAATEMLGEAIIRKFRLWNQIFPNYQSVKKATSKRNQKDGIDFFVTLEDDTVVNVDIKICCGPDFSLNKDECYKEPEKYRIISGLYQAPIELKQNGFRTFTSRKKTDYLLFIFADNNGISYTVLDYDKIIKIIDDNVKDNGMYLHHISNNRSGEYICFPVSVTKLF